MDEVVWSLDGSAQAELVRSGRLGAVELVEVALARAETLAALNATTVLLPEHALATAAVAEGPFAGVPILLKDAGQELEGAPMWMGAKPLRDIGYTSSITTNLVARLEALGFVVIGKSAVPELMIGISAAVAAGVVPLAHGSDSTGSLRYPASCCGVLTLKPSVGRVPCRLPAGIDNPGGAHVDFVLARSARDLRAVFAGVADSSSPPLPETIRRVGVLETMPFGLPIDPGVENALSQVAGELEHNGTAVELVSSAFLERYGSVLGDTVSTIVEASRAAVVDWIEQQLNRSVSSADLSSEIVEAASRGRHLSAGDVEAARLAISRAAAVASSWTDEVDALLLPVLDRAPWQHGTRGSNGLLGGLVCSLANFAGQPSTVIPTVQEGLPVGVQLQSRRGADEALLGVLAAIRPEAPTSPMLDVR